MSYQGVALPELGVQDLPAPIQLLAFDPGGRTGWVRAEFTVEGELATESIQHGELGAAFGGAKPHHYRLWRFLEKMLDENPHLMVVAEDYRVEYARAQDPVALEYLGILEVFCEMNLVSFERQDRGFKTFWSDEKLKAVGFYFRGEQHARDAARHWLAYARMQNPMLAVKLMARLK